MHRPVDEHVGVELHHELAVGRRGARSLDVGVVAVAAVGRRVYLNFGLDWRTDFTAVVAAKKAPAFAAAGIELARLAGRAVRLRGWIRRRNGPALTLTHPAQIELLAY